MESVIAALRLLGVIGVLIIVTFMVIPFALAKSFIRAEQLFYWQKAIQINMCRVLCWVCRLQVSVDNEVQRLINQGDPMVIVSHHLSYFDVMTIGSVFKCGFVAMADPPPGASSRTKVCP